MRIRTVYAPSFVPTPAFAPTAPPLSLLSGNTFLSGDVSINVVNSSNITIFVNALVGNTALLPA